MASWSSQWPAAVVFAFVITFLCCRAAPMLSPPEFSILDKWFQLRPPRQVHPDIALIGIETEEIEAFREQKLRGQQPATCTCTTVRRDELATAIKAVKLAGAKVVGLDMVFEVPCHDHDPQLLAALEMPQETVVVSCTNPTPGKFNFLETISFQQLKRPVVSSPVLYNPRGVVHGVRLIQRDPIANPPAPVTLSMVRPPFALACYAAYRGRSQDLPEEISDSLVECTGTQIPVWTCESVVLLPPQRTREADRESKHALLINWAGNIGTFPMYSMRRVLEATARDRREWFKGKIVLVGTMQDQQLAPVGQPAREVRYPLLSQAGLKAMTGVEVHANALDTVMQGRYMRPVPLWLVWLIIFAASFGTIAAFRYLHPARAVALALAELLVLVVAAQALSRMDYWLYSFIPFVAIFLSGISGAVWADACGRRTAASLAQNIEARDAVTTTLVHDLKQPLAAINALAQVLRMQQQKDGAAPTPELIQRIQQQVQMALGDIDGLLVADPNRELPLDVRSFDLAALAHDLATTQGLKSPIHKVEVQAPEEGVWVDGDPRYLGRALNNLLDNAIKYWPGGGTIIVEVKREPGQVSVRVIDHGLGISPEGQARLFNRFQRAVPEGMNIPGTGIGLFSIRRIMEAHGGRVGLVSALGEGSIFTLTLPTKATNDMPVTGSHTE
ncbi:MAG: CHASE2 domain-containing protein [Armatimonadia bacterium]